MSIDIFPNLNLPVIYVAQPYGGMDPAQMEGLLTNYYEYHFLYISGIHHVESRNVQGMALMKLFFHPGTNMAQAMAETIGYVTRSRAFMPPGTVSPFITRFDAGSVPVGYLVLSSETKSIGEIQDQALFKVRPMFASLPGVSAPPPFGGNQRTVVVRVDPDRLRSYPISPDEVITALTNGNTISPSGNVRIGEMMPIVPINSLVRDVKELETIPIRVGANPSVYIRDVATVQDASDIPAGYALVNGRRAVYILVTKRADASTLSVVSNVKEALPKMQAVLPDDIKVSFEFDQSPTVTNAMRSLATEGRSGRRPHRADGARLPPRLAERHRRRAQHPVRALRGAGRPVAHRPDDQPHDARRPGAGHRHPGRRGDRRDREHPPQDGGTPRRSPRPCGRGTMDTAVPRLLAMLCILAVFLPSFFMQGAAQALFVPLSLAVGFAMVSSYLLSSTFVPVLSTWLLRNHHRARRDRPANPVRRGRSTPTAGLSRVSSAGGGWSCRPIWLWPRSSIVGVGRSLGLEIFPKVDAGRFQLRMRGPDRNADRGDREAGARGARGDREGGRARTSVEISVGYVGLIPSSYPINAIFQWTGGPEEVVLRVALKEGTTVAVEALKERLRDDARRADARGAVLVRAGRHRQRGHELRLADARRGRRQRPEPRREPGVRREGPRRSWRRSRRSATSSSSRRSTTRP